MACFILPGFIALLLAQADQIRRAYRSASTGWRSSAAVDLSITVHRLLACCPRSPATPARAMCSGAPLYAAGAGRGLCDQQQQLLPAA
jgi:hypothetical protein